jgi:hypothetical protein
MEADERFTRLMPVYLLAGKSGTPTPRISLTTSTLLNNFPDGSPRQEPIQRS